MGKTSAFGTALGALALAAVAGAAVVEGVVVERSTGRPVSRARISAQSLQAQSSARGFVFTDSAGHFHLPDLQAGTLLLSAEKRGYAPAYYGQKKWNGPGTPIVLEKDSRFAVELRLSRLGAISGEIVDENGMGIPDVQVYAYKDERPLRLAGQGVSDDRGVFRIAGLLPGRYRVRTGPRQLEDGTGVLPTYFANTLAAESANVVEVRLDEEAGNVSIRPIPGKLLRLSGRLNLAGAPAVTLYSDMGRRVATVDGSGRFTFDALSPGNVELVAESNVAGRSQSAYARLWLSGDLEGVTLDPAPSPAVQFRCEDREGKPLGSREASLMMVRTSPPDEARSQRLPCGEAAAVSVGTWRLSVSTPSQYFVADLLVQRQPVLSNELQMLPGQSFEITLVASPSPAALRGTVLGPGGQPAVGAMVFLRAVDEAVSRRVYGKDTARAGPGGSFAVEGLPPGRYRVAASFDVQTADEVDWANPSLASIELEEGKESNLDLRLPVLP
jgi:protocatechuate 3,4-dioxygenase beta subunit